MNATLRLTPEEARAHLLGVIEDLGMKAGGKRIAIGLAGGPGVGKSTLAAELVADLNASAPGRAALVPMDGFHIKHAVLEAMGETESKGAPHTFEGAAFVAFLRRLKSAQEAVSGPGYSRKIEDTVDDAFVVEPGVQILVVEGNYLLLPEPPWNEVRPLLDLAVFINVPRQLVEARLLRRHAEEGLFTEERNRAHIVRNDLPNYDRVEAARAGADLVIEMVVSQ
jgi:pantothenate kinase